MKKIIALLLSILIVFSAAALGGCNKTEPEPTESSTEATQPDVVNSSEDELGEYLAKFTEGDNPVYGTWKLDNYSYLSFVFRNDNLAEMVMGTEGDFTALKLDEENKTLTVQFILGLNGTYSYTVSDDGKILSLKQGANTTVLKRAKDYDIIPKAPKKPKVDSDILGWWESESGLVYFFGADGIMYSNHISMETGYTYTAKNGKISATYQYGGDVKTELSYKYKDGTLTIDGNEYSRMDNE